MEEQVVPCGPSASLLDRLFQYEDMVEIPSSSDKRKAFLIRHQAHVQVQEDEKYQD